MTVTSVEGTDVICELNDSGEIGDRKGVNLPGAITDMPAMS